MNRVISSSATVALVLALSGGCQRDSQRTGAPAEKPKPLSTPMTCINSGLPVSRDIFVDHEGLRIYFCCRECIEVFRKDPENYIARMRLMGMEPEKTPGPEGGSEPAAGGRR